MVQKNNLADHDIIIKTQVSVEEILKDQLECKKVCTEKIAEVTKNLSKLTDSQIELAGKLNIVSLSLKDLVLAKERKYDFYKKIIVGSVIGILVAVLSSVLFYITHLVLNDVKSPNPIVLKQNK